MTTTSHRDCPHPATKAARTKCRKDRAAQVESLRSQAGKLIYDYYQGADFELVIYPLMDFFPEVKEAYFHTDASPDELISLARQAKHAL